MFSGQSTKYDAFRAKIKIWLPTLVTLDGIDFSKDEVKINEIRAEVEQAKASLMSRSQPLASIPEDGKGQSAGA